MRVHKQIVVTDGKLGHRGVEASGCMLEPKTGWRGENFNIPLQAPGILLSK